MSQIGTAAEPELRRYGPTARRLFSRALAERVPLSGMLELTHRCNLSCVHCYVNRPAADRTAARREMTAKQIARLVDELAELGTFKLAITGGEPLVRGDFADIYKHAHGRGILLVIFTNATLITRRTISLWREFPPARVEVTQYGATESTYRRVTEGRSDSFARFRRGVSHLAEAGIRFSLKTMAMRSTRAEVSQMKRFADSLGVEFRFDAIISPRIDGGLGPLAERLSPAEIAILEESSSGAAWADACVALNRETEASDRVYWCGAGHQTFTVDPYGRLHMCELSRRPGVDVVRHGFARGWYGEIPRLRAEARAPDASCTGCATAGVCSNCAGMAELEGRSHSRGDQYLCNVAGERTRRAAELVQIRPHSPQLHDPAR